MVAVGQARGRYKNMEKVAEYKIFQDMTSAGLEAIVNDYLGQGWQPYGELLKAPINKSYEGFTQAMVRYEAAQEKTQEKAKAGK